MKIGTILRPENVLLDIQASTKKDILTVLAGPIAKANGIDLGEMVNVLLNREKLGSTGIGEGVAIPHGKVSGLPSIAASIGISPEGLKFDALDGKPCHIFFLLVAPNDSISGHLKALARASMLLKDPEMRSRMLAAATTEDLFNIIMDRDQALGE